MYKKPLDRLLSQEVDRKEFLAHIGAAGLGMIGVSSLIKALTDHGSPRPSSDYGSSGYGGDRKLGQVNKRLG